MSRARETAQIIAASLPGIPMESTDLIREGAPIPPEPPVASWRPGAQYFEDGARIEAAFRRFIHRADPDQEKDSYEIIVCHANVIRYFVCRALQLPPEAWLRMSLHHSSITWLTIRPNGLVSLRTLGDSGHIPPHQLTTS
jgi:serine/threonine-protein phosphatase PGAM5